MCRDVVLSARACALVRSACWPSGGLPRMRVHTGTHEYVLSRSAVVVVVAVAAGGGEGAGGAGAAAAPPAAALARLLMSLVMAAGPTTRHERCDVSALEGALRPQGRPPRAPQLQPFCPDHAQEKSAREGAGAGASFFAHSTHSHSVLLSSRMAGASGTGRSFPRICALGAALLMAAACLPGGSIAAAEEHRQLTLTFYMESLCPYCRCVSACAAPFWTQGARNQHKDGSAILWAAPRGSLVDRAPRHRSICRGPLTCCAAQAVHAHGSGAAV